MIKENLVQLLGIKACLGFSHTSLIVRCVARSIVDIELEIFYGDTPYNYNFLLAYIFNCPVRRSLDCRYQVRDFLRRHTLQLMTDDS